jgi:hypothetical protein
MECNVSASALEHPGLAHRERVGRTPLRAGHVRPRQGVARRDPSRLLARRRLPLLKEGREHDVLGLLAKPAKAAQTD